MIHGMHSSLKDHFFVILMGFALSTSPGKKDLSGAPVQNVAVKRNFLLRKFLAVKKKSASEIFLSGRRGAKNFSDAFRIVFFIFFRVVQTLFRIELKLFQG